MKSHLPLLCEISQAKSSYLNVNQDDKELSVELWMVKKFSYANFTVGLNLVNFDT